MRFTEFLRVAVLLFGAAATALAIVSIFGLASDAETVLALVAIGWWTLAAVVGLWLGRHAQPSPGIGRLLSGARASTSLPEVEPGAILFNRLWPLAVFAVVAGAVGFFLPQVPAVATGYAILAALAWRRQSSAVQAIEDRDGVRFFFDKSSPFGAPSLLRTPWARRIEPVPGEPREEPTPL